MLGGPPRGAPPRNCRRRDTHKLGSNMSETRPQGLALRVGINRNLLIFILPARKSPSFHGKRIV